MKEILSSPEKGWLKSGLAILIFLTTHFSVYSSNQQADIPIITTDFCGQSVVTKIQGTSTEVDGTLVKVYVRSSVLDLHVELGTATVLGGEWQLAGLSLTSGLISAKAVAPAKFESDYSADIELTVPPIISQGVLSNPTICGALDGAVELLGFLPFTEYDLHYTDETGFQSVTVTADALGAVTISGLGEGEFQEIYAGLNGCLSNSICSVELLEPTIPTFTLGVPVQPVVCGGTGEILIVGAPLQALDYQVSYYNGSSTVGPSTITSSVLGVITISGLVAGTYSDFQVSRNGCDASLLLDRLTIYDGLLPSVVTLGGVSQPSSCTALDGAIELLGLNPLLAYDVFYEDENGITTSASFPSGSASVSLTGLGEGSYRNLRILNSLTGCYSTPLDQVDLSSLPSISLGTLTNPLSCLASDGSIEIGGLISGQTYDVNYTIDGASQSVSLVANSSGIVALDGLVSASYTNFFVEDGNCQSNILDDIISLDPIPIPKISLGTTSLPSLCGLSDGSIELLGLLPTTTYDLSYNSTSGLQTGSIATDEFGNLSITGLDADEYSDINVSINGCSSNSIVCPVDLDIIPALSLGLVTPETTCGAADGTITLLGLDAVSSYDISYNTSSGLHTEVGVVSTIGGAVTLTGLSADTYSDMSVTLGGCSSESLADISIGGLFTIGIGPVTNPVSCGAIDGSIVLTGLTGSTTYDVSYVNDSGTQTVSLTSDGAGLLTIPNLGAGNYSSISVNNGSCDSNELLNVLSLVEPGVPSISLGVAVNPTSCVSGDGTISLGGLAASSAYDVFFTSSAGAQTDNIVTNALGVLTISGLSADDYQDIYVSLGGCESNTISNITSLIDIGTPSLTLGTLVNPSDCMSSDGSIGLTGLGISTSYDISYTNGSGLQTTSISSDGSGNLIIPDLSADFYENIKVEIGGCLSVAVGPVDLGCDNEATYSINNQTIDVLNTNDVLADPTDPDGDIVCAALISGTLPPGISLNATTGEIYVSDESVLVIGSTTVNVETGDVNGDFTTQDVTFEVLNDTPEATDDTYSVDEGETVTVDDEDGSGGDATVFGVIVNDSDIAFSSLTVTKLTDPSSHDGTFTLNADGTFVYTHDGSETITDSFTYRLADGLGKTDDASVTISINPVNDPPVVSDIEKTVNEDVTVIFEQSDFVSSYSDPENSPLDKVQILTLPPVSEGVIKLNGVDITSNQEINLADLDNVTLVPFLDFNGSTSFDWNGHDGTVYADTEATVNITITPQNDAPLAVVDSYTYLEGSTNSEDVAGGVLTNDSDEDGDGITAILVSDVTNGTLSLNADGSFDYEHAGTETTTDSFTYKVNDGTVDGNTVTVSITITPQNDAPLAVVDSYTYLEGSTNSEDVAGGVLTNDSDEDGDGITAILVSDVTNGTLSLNADGSFDYEHDGTETTTDSFTYKVNDGTVDGNTVTVSITITPQNDAPLAVVDSYTYLEGSTNSEDVAGGVLTNDSDEDGDGITAILVSDVTNGTLSLNADGSFDYEHAGTETTTDSFTYKVNDGTVDGNTVTVSITITPQNDAPLAVVDSYTYLEGSTNSEDVAGGVLTNDSDEDGDGITAILVSDVTNGTLSLNADGSFDYEHDGTETTTDSFTYKVNDGTVDGNTVIVSITITPQNDAPLAVVDSYTYLEGSTNSEDVAGGVLTNDSDEDGDGITAILVSDVTNGTLSLNADGSFDYEHDGTETTTDSFTYKVNDGTVDGNTVTVSITITPQNDAPLAVVDSYTYLEGSTNSEDVAGGVLTNDSDEDGDGITAILVSDVTNGTLSLNADGSFDYEHDGTETTTDSFTYKVNDGTVDGNTVIVSITITPQNDTPTVLDDIAGVDPGNTVVIAVLANDTDIEGDDLTVSQITIDPTNGNVVINGDGTVSYTPDGGFTSGTDVFSYEVCDDGSPSQCAVAEVTVTVPTQEFAPVAVDDVLTVNEDEVGLGDVLSNDSDGNGDLLTVNTTPISDVSNGTLVLNDNGTFTYTPDDDYFGTDTFVYEVCDNAFTPQCDQASATITINPVNDPPEADDEIDVVNEGEMVTINISDGDTDLDGTIDLNSVVITTAATNGSVQINGDGTVDYTHDGTETTSDTFTYTINDNEGATSNEATVNITITPVNDPPVTVTEVITVINGGVKTSVDGGNSSVLDNDLDDENDVLTAILVNDVSNGTLQLNLDGTFSYTHDGSATSIDSFDYKANDGEDGNTVTVSIIINATNSPPVADDEMESVDEGSITSINVSLGDNDPDGSLNLNSILIVSGPVNGSLTVTGGGFVEYTHDGSETTGDSFTYTIEDDQGALSNVAMVTIAVTEVNDPPIADDDSEVTEFGESVVINVVDGDTDVDGSVDVASIVIVDQPTQGLVTDNGDGTITYAHDGLFEIDDQFTYTINDDDGAVSNLATVLIEVLDEGEDLITVPDVFTPNGDGSNDFWTIDDIENYPNNVVKVFNRWGNEIIEIKGYNNMDQVWDSKSQARLTLGDGHVPDGTYFYVIQLEESAPLVSGFVVVSR